MKFGITLDQYVIIKELVLSPLSAKNAKIFVFGSRARGSHHPFSDLDLLYKEDAKNPIEESLISKIREDLENSPLPYKIDLVNDKNLASAYRESVVRDATPFEIEI